MSRGFKVAVSEDGQNSPGLWFRVEGPSLPASMRTAREYHLPVRQHHAYLDLFQRLAEDFGTRVPRARQPQDTPTFTAPLRPLLTSNLSPDIWYGYGDPAVIRVGDSYYLLATSNDAPQSFPIARSRNLADWELVGFVFPEGKKPAWAADGVNISDYWAPEMHWIGGEFRVYFAAREKEGHTLAIGLARSPRPDGGFVAAARPLLGGGVIDPHVLVDEDGTPFLFWKEDTNDLWPGLLGRILYGAGESVTAALFPEDEDELTASFQGALWPWAETLEPMERFFVQHTLIEAVIADLTIFRQRLDALLRKQLGARLRADLRSIRSALRTRVYGQRLSPDGCSLIGRRATVLENDREWEAHLVEGVWVSRYNGRYYLFYAGNDFSTANYGIGVAVADAPLGPYRKMPDPLLRSTAEWVGPGHPSVAMGLDGRPELFLHAYFPGRTGYKEFRGLLAVPIEFRADGVALRNMAHSNNGGAF